MQKREIHPYSGCFMKWFSLSSSNTWELVAMQILGPHPRLNYCISDSRAGAQECVL